MVKSTIKRSNIKIPDPNRCIRYSTTGGIDIYLATRF